MNINQPPSGYAAQLSWCIQAIQSIWRRLAGLAQGSGGGGNIPTFQQVTDSGNSTTNNIIINNPIPFIAVNGSNLDFQIAVQSTANQQQFQNATGIIALTSNIPIIHTGTSTLLNGNKSISNASVTTISLIFVQYKDGLTSKSNILRPSNKINGSFQVNAFSPGSSPVVDVTDNQDIQYMIINPIA